MIQAKLKRQIDAELQKWRLLSSAQYVILLKREEKERQEKEDALAREEKALAEVERLRALLQEKDIDPG